MPPASPPTNQPSAGRNWILPLNFGRLNLRSNLFLSPLAGFTNLPFRLTVRGLGGLDLCTTDLVSVRSLLRRNPVALALVATCAADSPLAVQLFGADPHEMADGAQMLEEMGIAAVDVNMGCPVDKVVRTGSGSLLMTCPGRAERLIATMASAVRIPITAKMRLGWDEGELSAPGLARRLEDAGAAAIFVHGRTRAQGFSGRVSLAGVRAVVEAVGRIPVIGNGDVTTPEAARRMFAETGCAGVSIGRGAFYNPWIFRQTTHLLELNRAAAGPTFDDRIALLQTHFEHMVAFFGETRACVLFRKVAPWYARRIGPAAYFRRGMNTIRTRADFESLLAGFREWRAQFLEADGQLAPRYRPEAVRVAFAGDDEPEGADDLRIAVPKGPVAVW